MDIREELFSKKDEKYGDFLAKLTPTAKRETIIGVRAPIVKSIAKQIIKNGEEKPFLDSLPHDYYDENMLHSAILSGIKDYDEAIKRVEEFLPFVDNWAVCDTLKPKAFGKNKDKLIKDIKRFTKQKKPYTIRFGIEMLMNFYLDDDFLPEYLEIPAKVKSDEYYVNMMIAWFFATALAKKWDETIPYIENNRLDDFVHNKTIRKAIESYRITDDQKKYLRTLLR